MGKTVQIHLPDELASRIEHAATLRGVSVEELVTISVEEKMVRDTTITIPRALHKKLKKISTDRETSMNILVNTALAHWLAQKGALKLR